MKLKSNNISYERIGRSPFYIIKTNSTPHFAKSWSKNTQYKLSNWHIQSTEMLKAHQITKGKSSGIIAFIDSGTDLLNEALQAQNFINHAEDINGNGILDSLDLNGIDDDGNGYIDDVSGYDFVDTEISNLNFDFNDIDPFPQDEFSFGHGTFVHDLINSFLPNSKKMPLRAADANGLLEEDDVAKAIIYAQENGAEVINLSFGSKNYSAFLEAVINYVTDLGLIVVAASGNEARNELYYPAKFQNVIAVGNMNEFNRRSNSSNYGPGLDLLAPGTNIIALGLNQQSHSINGSSFASPIVASAVMLIKAVYPELNLNQIRHHLRKTADDINAIGYDNETGAGKLNIYRAVSEFTYNSISINYPVNQTFHNQRFPLKITANGTHIPDSLTLHVFSDNETIYYEDFDGMQFANEEVYEFNSASLAEGKYTIELFSDSETLAYSNFHIDHSLPVLDSIKADYIINSNGTDLFLEGKISKELTLSLQNKLYPIQKDFFTILSQENHSVDTLKMEFKDQNKLSLTYNLNAPEKLELKNHTQLITISDLFEGQYIISEHITDIDSNAVSEFWAYKSLNGIEIDSLHIFELNGNQVQTKKKMRFPYLLRDSYFNENENSSYALFSYSGLSKIIKIDQSFNFTEHASAVNKGLASKFIEINGDANPEVLMRSTFKYDIYSNNLSQALVALKNEASANAVLGIPNAQVKLIADNYYVYFNDSEGNILSYRVNRNNASTNYLGSVKQSYPAGIQSLRIDKDRLYVLGEKVNQSLFDDNLYDKSRRALDVFSLLNPALPEKIKTLYFKDQSLNANDASILVSNDQLAIHSGNDLFLMDSLFQVTRLLSDVKNIYFATDLNKFIYSSSLNLKLAEYENKNIVYPVEFLVTNPSLNSFNFKIKSNQAFDKVYIKSISNNIITVLDSLYSEEIDQNISISNQPQLAFIITYFLDGERYSYRISEDFPAYVKPQIKSAEYISDGILIRSNSKLNFESIKTQDIQLSNSSYYAMNQLNEYSLLLKSNDLASNDILSLENLSDAYGRTFNDTTINLLKANQQSNFYVLSYTVKENKALILEMNSSFSNDLEITEIKSNQNLAFNIENNRINLTEKNNFRAGEHYSIKIEDQLKTAYFGYRFKLDISKSILFPNPVIAKEHQFLTITNLKRYDHLRIFNFYGYKVFDKQFFEDLDAFRLDLDKDFKNALSSGIYFYVIEKTGKTIQSKFTVIR